MDNLHSSSSSSSSSTAATSSSSSSTTTTTSELHSHVSSDFQDDSEFSSDGLNMVPVIRTRVQFTDSLDETYQTESDSVHRQTNSSSRLASPKNAQLQVPNDDDNDDADASASEESNTNSKDSREKK